MVTRTGRRLQWFTIFNTDETISNGGQANHNLLSGLDADLAKDSTVTRIILEMWFRPGQLTSTYRVPWGITFVNADAVIAGALPDPGVAGDNTSWLIRSQTEFSSGDLSDSRQDGRVSMDIRSQRICRSPQEQLHLIIDLVTSGSALAYDSFSRVLVRLP